ncbi:MULTISPECIES: DUF2812 domain-containing protein [Terrabacteria group]|uniref:DUF2812 domain-containing protein n=1 Tax=Bacillati TaxID=1783272 RepID=UPI001C6F5745|nr:MULTISPECIES: DUF2812 domain-containing protein [Terrabacteria group]MBW9212443.1 DUF2812 domain-containing protein [Trueperella sp. zg.1013]
MAKQKTKMRFFTIADYSEEEKWLEQEHKNGWKFVKMTIPCFFVFEECPPENAVYKLEYKEENAAEDYLQMYQDYGWDYLGSCWGWNYFRKIVVEGEDENDKEIFSDTESKITMINHILKTRMWILLVIFCVIIILNIRHSMFRKFGFVSIVGLIYLILFILYLYLLIHSGLKLRKIKKDLLK